MKDINPVSTTQKQRLVSVANANDTIINTNYNIIIFPKKKNYNIITYIMQAVDHNKIYRKPETQNSKVKKLSQT